MKKLVKGLGLLAAAFIVTAAACGGSDKPAAPAGDGAAAPAATDKPAEPAGVTLAQFEQVANGQTYEEVVAILGFEGTVSSESEIAGIKTAMYTWKGDGFGANMNAMFQDGKLISKAQFGLK